MGKSKKKKRNKKHYNHSARERSETSMNRKFDEAIQSRPTRSGATSYRSRDRYGSMRDYSRSPFNESLQEVVALVFGGRSFQLAINEDHLIDAEALEELEPPKFSGVTDSDWDDEFETMMRQNYQSRTVFTDADFDDYGYGYL